MKIYDVTLPMWNGMAIYKGDPAFNRKEILSISRGDPCTLSVITMGAHSGTHFDAPAHMVRRGKTFDSIDPALFFGKALVVEIRDKERIDRPELEKTDFKGIRKVFFKTANSRLQAANGAFRTKFVHFTGDAAEYLGKKKKLELVAIDYLSVDEFGSPEHPAHSAFMKHNVLILESVNLSGVKPGVYDYFAGPLLIKDADSGPARVFLTRPG